MGIKDFFRALGDSLGPDIEEDSDVKFTPEQQRALESVEERTGSVESPISESEQSKARKGLRKKYEAPNIKTIEGNPQENLEKMTKTLKGEKEIGE